MTTVTWTERFARRRQRAALFAELAAHVGPAARSPEQTAPRRCPVCDSDDARPAIASPVYHFHRCQGCTLLYTRRLLKPEVTRRLYGERPIYKTYWERQLADAEAQVGRQVHGELVERLLQRVPRRGTAIDVGCGFGKLVAELRPHFREVIGLEPNRRTAHAAERLHGVKLHAGRLDRLVRAPGTVDLIVMDGVLEHLVDVLPAIGAAHRLLAPGGVLYVALAHGESAGLRLAGGAHPLVATHLVVNLFTAPSLRRLGADAGFVLESAATDGEFAVHLGESRFGIMSEHVISRIAVQTGLAARLGAGARLEAFLRRPRTIPRQGKDEGLLAAV
jgi:SAM-dependent methyltransferase